MQASHPTRAIVEPGRRGRPLAIAAIIRKELKAKGQAEGLWDIFLPESEYPVHL